MNNRILVLDDEEAVARAVARDLKRGGFEIAIETDPDRAWAYLQANEVAVIISDQCMPRTTGVDFLERCAREYPLVAQILLTGLNDPSVPIDAINRTEVVRYLSKPWTGTELVDAVRQAAWTSEMRRAT